MTTINVKNEKLTYVTALTYAIENGNLPAEIAEKLIALRTQQEKRNSGEKKPTKVQEANMGLKEIILQTIGEATQPLTVTELMASNAELSPTKVSAQKISALVTQLVKAGKLERIEEKRKAYFRLA